MNLQESIAVALEFERKVRDHYLRGAADIPDEHGRRVFAALAREEQAHVDYLERCLDEWRRRGKVQDLPLGTLLPVGARWLEDGKKRLAEREGERVATRTELEALRAAVELEKEADAFYHRLVSALPSEHQPLFQKFLGIEDRHLALVEAQLEAVQGRGFWFDVSEFIQDG